MGKDEDEIKRMRWMRKNENEENERIKRMRWMRENEDEDDRDVKKDRFLLPHSLPNSIPLSYDSRGRKEKEKNISKLQNQGGKFTRHNVALHNMLTLFLFLSSNACLPPLHLASLPFTFVPSSLSSRSSSLNLPQCTSFLPSLPSSLTPLSFSASYP